MFKLTAKQKKLLNKFVDENLAKLGSGLDFDVDRARWSDKFPTLTAVYDAVAMIKNGDMLYACVNAHISKRTWDLQKARIAGA